MTPWTARTRWIVEGASARVELDDGATMTLRFLGERLARVTLKPAAGYKEPRTWSIAPLADGERAVDTPWQGRDRDDLAGFGTPAVTARVAGVRAASSAADDIEAGQADASAPAQTHAPTLGTSKLIATLHIDPLRIEWRTAPGRDPFCADRATSAYLREARTGTTRHYVQRSVADRYYGLGDKTGPLNLHGRRLRTLAMDALGYDPEHGDPLYKHWPFVLVRAADGTWYGQYHDTLCACTFDLGCEHDNYHGFYRHVEIDDGDLDVWMMVGDSPADVISAFMKLIGGTALPPRWSLGFAQTAMGLADAPDAQSRLADFIDRIAEHRIPISAFHYGSGYSSRGARRYVFTWNHAKFPDPKALNARFHAQGMNIVANIKPCLLDDHPDWDEVKAFGGFIHDRDQGEPVLEPFWDGMGAHLDFTHPHTIAWWQRKLDAQVLGFGIDAGWNDNNEYAVLDEAAQCDGFGAALPMHRCRPLHALLMTRATVEAQRARAEKGLPHAEPFTVTRAGPPGIQRYAQTWSGDNTTSWRTLRWNIRTGLQMSLSGMFNIGHDVGGFYGPLPDAELFLRWVQACCLNPRMVMNSWKPGGESNLPWMHPEVVDDVRRAIELRCALMPYLWKLAERAHTHHEPIIRPTFFDFPDVEKCFDDSDDFMLGPDLLVAPVVEPGARQRQVFLPPLPDHKPWHAFDSGDAFASGRSHAVHAPLSRLPLFVRHGARIPIAARPDDADPGLAPHDWPTVGEKHFG